MISSFILVLAISLVFTLFIAMVIRQRDIQHTLTATGWQTEFLGTGLVMHHSNNVETAEQADACFAELDNLHPLVIMGSCFHLAQQLGGHLSYKGKRLRCFSLVDATGEPLDSLTVIGIERDDGQFESAYVGSLKFGY